MIALSSPGVRSILCVDVQVNSMLWERQYWGLTCVKISSSDIAKRQASLSFPAALSCCLLFCCFFICFLEGFQNRFAFLDIIRRHFQTVGSLKITAVSPARFGDLVAVQRVRARRTRAIDEILLRERFRSLLLSLMLVSICDESRKYSNYHTCPSIA